MLFVLSAYQNVFALLNKVQVNNADKQSFSWITKTRLSKLGDIMESLEAMGYQAGEETQVLR